MPSCATASPSPATAASANRSRKRKGRRSLITSPSENALVLTQHLIQRAIDLHADLLLNVDVQVDDDRILRRFDAHRRLARRRGENPQRCRARKSVWKGKSVSVRVDVRGRRKIKKKKRRARVVQKES